MRIISVTTKSLTSRFHKVPFFIYKNDKEWIPHIKQEVDDVFNEDKNDLFVEGVAIRWVLEDEGGKDIGRIAAFIDKKKSQGEKQLTGGVGFFECIDDTPAASMLFNTAKDFLTNHGMAAMDGPINFGERNKYWGLLVDGHDRPPIYGNAYQPAYYQKLFEDYGFKVYFSQYMYEVGIQEPMKAVFKKRLNTMANKEMYSFKHIELKNLNKYADDFRTIYNTAWQTHSNFNGLSQARARAIFKKMKMVIDEKLVWFVYFDNKPVAFLVSLPELNEIFKYVNGNLNLWGKMKFMFYKWLNGSKNAFGVVFGIVPDHQSKGVESLMLYEIKKALKTHNPVYEKMILTWIGDFNPKMMRIVTALSEIPYQKLHTYRILFDPKAKFEKCEIIE
jgi:hypothetical protein|tara:strand:- start:3774 stop:4940 length:1167 start_codon:yes stop_codon:yes gene_type:complete